VSFFLEYRCVDPKLSGNWGPFGTRSQADDFAKALNGKLASWSVITLRNPDAYTFSD
jgi:hypothetical protein